MNEIVRKNEDLVTDIGETTDEVSWKAPAKMTYDQWCAYGRTFQQINRSIAWWTGDWLCAGERRFGDIALQAIEETGRGIEALLKYKAVAARFKPEDRRPGVSWSHHLAVAYMDEEFRADVLAMAERYDLSTRDVKIATAMPVRFLNILIRAYQDNTAMAEFYRLFELTRLEALAWNRATVIDVAPKTLPETAEADFSVGDEVQESDYSEEVGGELPFVDLGDEDAYDWEDELDQNIDAVFSFFEKRGAPVKAVYTSEVIWEGISVHAGINRDGQPVLIWEQTP